VDITSEFNLHTQEVDLANIGNGAAMEIFAEEMQKVMANTQDPNTDAEEPREITLKVILKPNPQRDAMDVKIQVKSKLAPIVPASGTIYISKKGGALSPVQVRAKEQEIPFNVRKIGGEE